MDVSRDLISRATDKITEELDAWRNRPLDRVYAVVMIDAIVLKIRDGAVANRPVYIAVGINLEGERDVLGMWVGSGGEGAKTWMAWLAELKNRGIEDVLIACCDGLKGLPDSDSEHLAARRHPALRGPHGQKQPQVGLDQALVADRQGTPPGLHRRHGGRRRAAVRRVRGDLGSPLPGPDRLIGVWRRSWEHFVMFLRFPPEIRKIVYTTNMIESLNSRFRQATRRRGHFPNEEAALKVLYLVIRDRQPNRRNPTGRTYNWKEAINTLAGFYGDRVIDNQ
nr:transposase [Streptomyces sp. RB17]